MSHTTKIKVEFRDPDSLGAAVLALGGKVLGQGSHHLFGGNVQGFGFQMPSWHYPCILGADGSLSFDTYNGAWGNEADLALLKGEYSLQVAEKAANAQGWMSERRADEVIIYHPDGGIITVSARGVDASQFLGADCVSACAPIEQAIGSQPERSLKQEYFARNQEIIQQGGD